MQKFQYVRHDLPEILIDFLCRRFPYQAREIWIDHIEKGAVKIDGRQITPDYLLETKNVISYERPREDEPVVDDSYRILFEDTSIVVVEKSGNIPISESGKYYKNTLLYILKEKEGYTSLNAVHRLDRETSGVIVIARNSEIAELFRKQFTAAKPKKRYQAVLQGEMPEDEIMIDQPIKKIGDQGLVRIRQVIHQEGKPSQTLVKAVKRKGGLTLAEIETFTGRTHQIRCHMECIGFPILGDKLYGQTDERFLDLMKEREEPVFGEFGHIDRQLLHASRLIFNHPVTNQEMDFFSDPEPYFTNYIEVRERLYP